MHLTPPDGEAGRLRSAMLVYVALGAVVLAPFMAVAIPALGDTLNHLARMHVLAALSGSADLRRFYTVDWSPIPYLAMDAIVPLLARVLPIYAAGKLFVCLCVAMPAVAAGCLHWAVHRRVSLVPAAGFLLCTNYLLALGFLNFLFSAGCAVLLFAGWILARGWPRWWRAGALAPLLLLLYLGHAYAALAYCLAVAGMEAARALRAGRAGWRGSLLDVLAAGAQAVPALVFAARLKVAGGYVGALHTGYGNLGVKLQAVGSPVMLLDDPVYLATGLAALAMAVGLRRRVRLAGDVWPAVVVVGGAAAVMPHVVFSTWGMDYRLPLVAGMLLVGGISVPQAGAWRWAVVGVLAVLVAARSADAWGVLRRIDGEVAETRAVVAALPRGARLLVAGAAGGGTGFERVTQSTAWHMPLVAVIDRDAFVPYLFSGLSTVHVRPELRLSSTPNGLPITLAQLREGALAGDGEVEHGDGQGARVYHLGWPAKFDYVLVQGYDDPAGLPWQLDVVARGRGLALYRVRR